MPSIGAIMSSTGQKASNFRVARFPAPSPLLLALLLLFSALSLAENVRANDDAELRARFLLKLTRFVDWPTNAFDSANSSFVVCTMDAMPIQESLKPLAMSREFKGRRIDVREIEDLESAKACHLLFHGETSPQKLRAASTALIGKPVLSVAESEEFTQWGGVMQLKIIHGKVTISVNRNSAERANLKISARLLKIATVTD